MLRAYRWEKTVNRKDVRMDEWIVLVFCRPVRPVSHIPHPSAVLRWKAALFSIIKQKTFKHPLFIPHIWFHKFSFCLFCWRRILPVQQKLTPPAVGSFHLTDMRVLLPSSTNCERWFSWVEFMVYKVKVKRMCVDK